MMCIVCGQQRDNRSDPTTIIYKQARSTRRQNRRMSPVIVRKVFYTFLNPMYKAWITDLNFVYIVYKNTPKCKISTEKNLMRREHLIIKLQEKAEKRKQHI